MVSGSVIHCIRLPYMCRRRNDTAVHLQVAAHKYSNYQENVPNKGVWLPNFLQIFQSFWHNIWALRGSHKAEVPSLYWSTPHCIGCLEMNHIGSRMCYQQSCTVKHEWRVCNSSILSSSFCVLKIGWIFCEIEKCKTGLYEIAQKIEGDRGQRPSEKRRFGSS